MVSQKVQLHDSHGIHEIEVTNHTPPHLKCISEIPTHRATIQDFVSKMTALRQNAGPRGFGHRTLRPWTDPVVCFEPLSALLIRNVFRSARSSNLRGRGRIL